MKKSYLLVLISVICWASTTSVSKGLLYGLPESFTVAVSFLFASLFLVGQSIARNRIKGIRNYSIKKILLMTAVGSLGVFFYNILLLKGCWLLPAQTAFVINYLWPALIIVFSLFLLKEKMTLAKAIAVILSFAGVYVAVANGNWQLKLDSPTGVICCLIAAASYALYSTLNKKLDYDSDIAVVIAYVTGTVAAFIWMLVKREWVIPDGRQWIGLILYGVICNALPYLLWAIAMEQGETAIIANLAYLTPVVSLVMSHFFLKEQVTIYSVIGLALILMGIAVQIIRTKQFEKAKNKK